MTKQSFEQEIERVLKKQRELVIQKEIEVPHLLRINLIIVMRDIIFNHN